MNKLVVVRNLLFLLIIIYFLQGLLYPNGSIISQSAILLYLIISLYYFFKVNLIKNNPKFIIYLSLFIVMIGFYYVISDKVFSTSSGLSINTIAYLKATGFALLTFFPFYYLSKKNILTKKSILCFFVIYSIVIVTNFFSFSFSLSAKLGREDVVNNLSYSILSLFPFLLLINEKKILSYSLLSIFSLLVISGLKRGSILIMIFIVLIYLHYKIKQGKSTKKFSNIVFALIVTFGIAYILFYFFKSNLFLQYRIEQMLEGNSSGRNYIYIDILNYCFNSNRILNLIFGYGLWYSLNITGLAAHNDWLELLSNCGLIGIFLYGMIFYHFFTYIKKIQNNLEKKYILIMIFVIWFMKSLYSMGYMDFDHAPLMILIAYVLGSVNNNKYYHSELINCNKN